MLRDFHQAQLNFLPSATKSTTMCGDATNWDEEVYRESILKEREIQTRTVFRTVWAPSLNPSPETVVVASSDGSVSSYSIPSLVSNLPLGFSNVKAPQLLLAEPTRYLQAHEGPAYDVKFYGNGEDSVLLSCGDDGRIQGWRWKDCEELDVPLHLQGKHVKPVFDLVNPQHEGPWGALSPIPENNALAVNNEEGCIFSAAGDSSVCCWDVERGQVKMTFKGHADYVHSVVARNSTNQIITGSEDGTARIWGKNLGPVWIVAEGCVWFHPDCKSGKCVQAYEPAKGIKLKGFFSCVSCIALDASESWLALVSLTNITSIWGYRDRRLRWSCGCYIAVRKSLVHIWLPICLKRLHLSCSFKGQLKEEYCVATLEKLLWVNLVKHGSADSTTFLQKLSNLFRPCLNRKSCKMTNWPNFLAS